MVEEERPQSPEHFDLTRFIPEVDRAVGELLDTNVKLFIASTGAGAGITQLIWRTPGISKILVGTSFPYHRGEFQRFIGREFTEAYVSEAAAVALALAAYERALRAEASPTNFHLGIGLTATVTTSSQPTESRVVVAAHTSEQTAIISASMQKGYLDRVGEGSVNDLLALNMLLHVAGVRQVALPDLHLASSGIIKQNEGFVIAP